MEDKQVNNNETNETIILGEYTNTNDENKEPKPKRDSFFKTHKNAVLISTCVALSALGAFGGTMLATVSYTHLDVYKRQVEITRP